MNQASVAAQIYRYVTSRSTTMRKESSVTFNFTRRPAWSPETPARWFLHPDPGRTHLSLLVWVVSVSVNAQIERRVLTYSSSSPKFSPSSFATRRRFRNDIFPVLSSSKRAKALFRSVRGSRDSSFSVTTYKLEEWRHQKSNFLTDFVEILEFHQPIAPPIMVSQ